MPTETLSANANGSTNQWGQSHLGVQEYQTIDETSLSGAGTDYINATVNGRRSMFGFTNTSAASGATINSVTIHIAAKESGTSNVKYVVDADGDGSGLDVSSTAQALTTTLTEYTKEYTTNPDTSNAWTSSEIDAAEFGVQCHQSLGRNTAFVYAIWVVVDYTAAGYGHKVSGVAAANIGKVNGVATANIGKINTVD